MKDTESLEKSEVKTGKIFSSRVMKMSFGVILILTALYVFSTLTISFITLKAMDTKDPEVLAQIKDIASYLRIDVAGAIGAIMSLVTVRYTLRETTSNLKSPCTDMTSKK